MRDAVEISTGLGFLPGVHDSPTASGGAPTVNEAGSRLIRCHDTPWRKRCWPTMKTRPRENQILDDLERRSIFLNARDLPRRAKLSAGLNSPLEAGSPCVLNTTIPLVDRSLSQLKTPQVIHDSSATITSEIISESFFLPIHGASMEVEISHILQEWYGSEDFARVMASSRHFPRYGEGPVAQSYIDFRCGGKQNLEYMRNAH